MVENKENNYIYGKNPVCEILQNNPKRINKIYIQKNISYDNRLKRIVELANQNKIIVQNVDLRKFNEYFEEKPNFQGVVASVSPVEYIELEDFLKIKKDGYKRIIILDGISDPHNFGAIIRTAAAAGFDGVMVSNHRSCPISATVEKISSGAINHISIIKTTSLNASIDYLKKQDFWVIATQMEARDNYYEIDYTDMNFALVMGSEGSGISKTILNKADFTVKLESNFESLNVSAATAVIVYEALRQIRVKSCIKTRK
ncbi:MAG: 23S rRNA (guanosine(2251)-2'-O)-methyltransferase RlmB [Candidatus Gastranaerophilales bacterium]|nr:23S rRNA (guanosine(2251)-2'-O)-methyltransferase RlmB [Candidatus Gastranaerophilales bacterium]